MCALQGSPLPTGKSSIARYSVGKCDSKRWLASIPHWMFTDLLPLNVFIHFCLRNVDVYESRSGVSNWNSVMPGNAGRIHGRRFCLPLGHLPLCVLSFVVWSFRLADWTCYLHCPSLLPSQLIHISHQCNQWAQNSLIQLVRRLVSPYHDIWRRPIQTSVPMYFIAFVMKRPSRTWPMTEQSNYSTLGILVEPTFAFCSDKNRWRHLQVAPRSNALSVPVASHFRPVTNGNVCLHFQEPRLEPSEMLRT